LKKQYPAAFEIGIHSVISNFNIANLPALFSFVQDTLKPDSYISEIAENREELLNMKDEIAPPVHRYEEIIRPLQHEIRGTLLHNRGLTGMIQAFRLSYYDYVIRELQEKRRVIPCYAGQVSAQISPWGDVWPCCILAYKADMGNLRNFDLDFNRLWSSKQAMRVRKQVARGDCYCPMANVHYTNMALTPSAMVRVCSNYLRATINWQGWDRT
jgi:MoaA/NifB/PqqE/SkfB family radical SAM enzyme